MMKQLFTFGIFISAVQICGNGLFAQQSEIRPDVVPAFKNTWVKAPANIPSETGIDAPLQGNGDITMSIGYVPGRLRYYLAKNDFWRLQSQFDKLAGPRVAGFLDITVD